MASFVNNVVREHLRAFSLPRLLYHQPLAAHVEAVDVMVVHRMQSRQGRTLSCGALRTARSGLGLGLGLGYRQCGSRKAEL